LHAFLTNPIADEAYGFLAPGDTLVAISTVNSTELRRTFYSSWPHAGLTVDGTMLYWFDPSDNMLNRIRATDFQPYPKLKSPMPYWYDDEMVASPNRIFQRSNDATLICVDLATGKQIGDTFPWNGGAIALAADGRTLYAAAKLDYMLYRFDMSADSFNVTSHSQLPAAAQRLIPINGGEAIGVVLPGNTVCVYDAWSLTPVNTINTPDLLWDVCFSSTHAYVSTANSIIEYDLRGGPTGRRWLCANSPYKLAVDRHESELFAEISSGGKVAIWAFSLL
jgi:hypothetical protein